MSFPSSPQWQHQPSEPQDPVDPQRSTTYENYSPPTATPQPGGYYPVPLRQPGVPVVAPYGVDPLTNLPYSSKSKVTAGILGIFLGGLGVGRFYTGQVGIGVAQLLVTIFTFGFGAWWGIIDGIVMLAGNPRDSNGLPLR